MTRILGFGTLVFFLTTVVLAVLLIKQGDAPENARVILADTQVPLVEPVLQDGKELMFSRGCTNCHDLKNTLLGPSFEAISSRYNKDADAYNTLVKSLRAGSSGKWANLAMPVQPSERVSDAELETILTWVLGLSAN